MAYRIFFSPTSPSTPASRNGCFQISSLEYVSPPLPSHNRRRLIMDYVDNKRHQLALLFLSIIFFVPPTPTMSGVLDSWSRDSLPPSVFWLTPLPLPRFSPGEASVTMTTGLSPIHVGMKRGFTWRPTAGFLALSKYLLLAVFGEGWR